MHLNNYLGKHFLYWQFCQIYFFQGYYSGQMSNLSVPFVTDVIITATNSVSVLLCLLATSLVFHYKLHKTVVYRLALYQVLASLAFATVEVFQIIFAYYDNAPGFYGSLCTAIGWISIYTRWVKVIFTTWVTFHLFYFAVFYKNLKKYEVVYVVTSLLVPAPIASVPLITHTYGVNGLGICFIFANDTNGAAGNIEKFSLWYGPAMFILLVLSIAMVVMVITLARRLCRRSKYEPITEGGQFWTALKQLLPLTAFPLLFFVFIIPTFITGVFISSKPTNANKSLSVTTIFIALWSVSSGVTLVIHIFVARCFAKRKSKLYANNIQLLNQCS